VGIASLAVDLGRVQLVKAELHAAADAAARYAAPGLVDGTTLTRAQAAAADNKAGGTPVVLIADDVAVGRWNTATRVFTANATPTNAVQITARRITARGNPVPLLFGSLLGVSPRDVSATAIGVSNVSFNGNITLDSYNSSIAPYSAGWSPDKGHVVSNGDIELIGSVEVRGDVRPGPGETATGGTVTGVRTPLPSELDIVPVTSNPYGPSLNDNANIPAAYRPGSDFAFGGTSLTIPAGTYYFRNFDVNGNAFVNVSGDVTIYVTGNMTIQGGTGVHRPQQLRFRGIGPGTFDLQGNQDFYAVIEAPTKTVIMGGTKDFFGSVVGNSVQLHGTPKIHYDESLTAVGGGGAGSTGSISQVR
jgi:hypothetical protein